jgi:putative transposase
VSSTSSDNLGGVTDAVSEKSNAWQARPLESIYAFVYLNGLHLKIRDDGMGKIKVVYLTIQVSLEGSRTCWASGWRT